MNTNRTEEIIRQQVMLVDFNTFLSIMDIIQNINKETGDVIILHNQWNYQTYTLPMPADIRSF
jgi:hypothetical protein